jgi:hypothetical protein
MRVGGGSRPFVGTEGGLVGSGDGWGGERADGGLAEEGSGGREAMSEPTASWLRKVRVGGER